MTHWTEKAAPKKAAVEKKRKDPNAPKGALTAYIIFRYEQPDRLRPLSHFSSASAAPTPCVRLGNHSRRDSLQSHKQSNTTLQCNEARWRCWLSVV